jgi:hypothetical protein
MAPITVRPRTQELLARVGPGLYREAYTAGMSLSAWLEQEDPSAGYNDGLDSFSRMLKLADIRVRSLPEQGIYANEYEKFYEHPQARSLIPEWCARVWRRTVHRQTRAVTTSDATPVGSAFRPYVTADGPLVPDVAPAIPISAVVAITTPIRGNLFRATYLTDDATQRRMVRVSESAEIPRVKLTSGERAIYLYKYGRVIEASYEVLRREPLDLIAQHIAMMAAQAEVDKLATIIDVAVNGDGNANTAATNYNASTLDSASTGGALTLLAWLAWKQKFKNPYGLRVALARDAVALKVQTINVGTANVMLATIPDAGFGAIRSIGATRTADDVGLGATDDAPSNAIVGLDSARAIRRVTEIGSDIQEIERFATRQTEGLVLSENEGYSVLDPNAVRTLTLT